MESMKGYTIAYKSLGVGVFDYSFLLDNEFFTHFEGSEITTGNCGVQVQLQRAESMLEIDVKIDGEVTVACDRCLEDCSIAIDYQGRLIVKFSAEVEDYDGDILWLSPAESEVDLSQYIYESVVLSLPYQRVHPEGECNEEMTRRFAIISGAELEQIEEGAQEGDGENKGSHGSGDAVGSTAEAESHGLAAEDLAKLQALRAKMSEE